jgi:two-component system, OmpR family, response regulator RpaA
VARILVIDDEPMIRTVLRYELEPAGHDVLLAEDGLRGVAFARRQKPDVIILDLMMPILDGYSVLEMLRKEEATARIPVIVLTAVTLDRVRRKCLAEGATHVLTKPFNEHDLSRTIAEALGELQMTGAGRPLHSYAGEAALR